MLISQVTGAICDQYIRTKLLVNFCIGRSFSTLSLSPSFSIHVVCMHAYARTIAPFSRSADVKIISYESGKVDISLFLLQLKTHGFTRSLYNVIWWTSMYQNLPHLLHPSHPHRRHRHQSFQRQLMSTTMMIARWTLRMKVVDTAVEELNKINCKF